jgi:hypothetical protein
MKRFFEIKKDTRAHELFHRLFTFENEWLALEKEIEVIIESPMKKNLALATERLLLSNPPAHLRDQFVKNCDQEGFLKAKVRSDVNKKWIAFVKEHNLEIPRMYHVTEELGISKIFGNAGMYLHMAHKVGDTYYFEGITEPTKGPGKAPDFTIEITEAEYLKRQAEQLEKDEKKKGNEINLEEIVRKFEEFSSYVAGIDREELKKQFTRKELDEFNEKIWNVRNINLWGDVRKIIDEKKLEEYPELLGVHNFPVLKEIDFMTEEEKITLDTKLTGYRVGDYLSGFWRFTKKEKELKEFLLDKGIIKKVYYLECNCEEYFLSEKLSEEEKNELEALFKKPNAEWTDADHELYNKQLESYCNDCGACEDDSTVKEYFERGSIHFKELLTVVAERDTSLDNV